MRSWRTQTSRVAAIPFVALYANGALRGCVGNDEGGPRENLSRAFLSALADTRFGGVRRADRNALAAEVSYLRRPRFVERDAFAAHFEAGTHGVGVAVDGGPPVFLLPSVARDGRLDASGMLAALDRKAGPRSGKLFIFDTETVVVRQAASRGATRSPMDAAASWLASLVARDGRVTFAVDARTGATKAVGEMHHARSAAVLHALRAHGAYRGHVRRGEARLLEDVRASLEGRSVEGWPEEPARVAGTLALAMRAGLELRAELLTYARRHVTAIASVPWHAAQVVSALGSEAPALLWEACVKDLDRRPWAPWTAFAAFARHDTRVGERATRGLLDAIADRTTPHHAAVSTTPVPEVAITALTVEALRASKRSPAVRRAIRSCQRFLVGCQLTRDNLPAPFAEGPTEGGFLASPISSLLRGDVAGHALLALLGS